MFSELDTPSLLVDRDRLQRNLSTFARLAAESGVAIRPHVKTHKSIEIAKLQISAGAVGITVAKLSEAEVYVAAGITDVFVAYPLIGEQKWQRAAELASRCRLLVGVESVTGVEGLATAAKAAGTTIGVRVEFDSGLHRSGVSTDELSRLCSEVMFHPSLCLEGIFTFRSSTFPGSEAMTIADMGKEEGQLLAVNAARLRACGFPIVSASGGSTPTSRCVADVPGVTEIRPGTYVFQDLMSLADGACGPDDLALTVLVTVVSRPGHSTAIVDAGSKTLAGDVEAGAAGLRSYGEVQGGGGRVAWLNEEHGAVQLADGYEPEVGERLRIVPVHACTVVNLADELVLVDGDRAVERWRVAARGCNR
jgi:D-serine deaminase-like pyridoxal phosphate-dependent protein